MYTKKYMVLILKVTKTAVNDKQDASLLFIAWLVLGLVDTDPKSTRSSHFAKPTKLSDTWHITHKTEINLYKNCIFFYIKSSVREGLNKQNKKKIIPIYINWFYHNIMKY